MNHESANRTYEEKRGKTSRANPVPNTIEEFALLTFFLRHPHEVLARDQIYEQVWGEPFDGLSNTVEYHVMRLRKVLEVHGPRLIHTLRGRGYRFGAGPSGEATR